MAERRKAKLFFGTHCDCFIHGLKKEWQSWLKLSTGKEGLRLVRLVFSNKFSLLANFSTRPALPSNMRSKKSVESDEYLEIDPEYGKCLNINDGEEVTVECIPELNICKKMIAVPIKIDEYEILDCNEKKIANEMLNQVRVVSAKHQFPIWFNNQPIRLKLIRSDPPAHWVLLVKNTSIEFQVSMDPPSESAVDLSPPPLRSHSDRGTRKSLTDLAPIRPTPKHRLSKSDVGMSGGFCYPSMDNINSPSIEEPDQDDPDVVSKLINSFTNWFRKSPDSDIGPSQSTTADKLPATYPMENLKPHTTNQRPLSRSVSGHIKQSSWHEQTEFERAKNIAAYAPFYTPPCHVILRTQLLDTETINSTWGIDNCFDIFVHPSSLPELYDYAANYQVYSFLVKLSLLYPQQWLTKKEELSDSKPHVSSNNSSSVTTPISDTTNHFNNEKGLFSRLASLVTEPADPYTLTPTPPSTTPSTTPTFPEQAPNQQPAFHSCRFVVARLHLTKFVKSKTKQKQVSSTAIQESLSREGSSSPTHSSPPTKAIELPPPVPVLPGHVVLSNFMRQLLGAESESFVLVEEVVEGSRVNCRHNKVTITLEPMDPLPLDDRALHKSNLINGFKKWVNRCENSQFGCIFADNMIIPIPIQGNNNSSPPTWASPNLVFCRANHKIDRLVTYRRDTPSRSNDSMKFFQLYSCDLKSDNYERVEIKIFDRVRGGKFARMIPLDKLQVPPQDIMMEQFGAIDDIFDECYRHLMLDFSQSRNGALLICGTGGGGARGVTSGCGKTSMANLLCKSMSESLWRFHIIRKECTLWRGKQIKRIEDELNTILRKAKEHEPVVVVFDDLDEIAGHITDAQKEASGEALVHTKTAQLILKFMIDLRSFQSVVIATSSTKQLLHPSLLHCKGRQTFHIVEIKPPNLSNREKILQALLLTHNLKSKIHSVLSLDDLRSVALKTEGFQAKDLAVLVDRAISIAEHRNIKSTITTCHYNDGNYAAVSPTYEQHSTPSRVHSKDSTTTIVPRRTWSTFSLLLTVQDFFGALENYRPAALKGVSLHSKGRITFKNVGGLEEAKRTLKETLLWPSKYPKIFKACPIKQHAGILLYGAPGTGKTMLAEAVANEFNLNFVSIKGPELLNKYIGASEQAVRDLFARALAATPCILFFDEFDSLAPRRGHDSTGVTDRVVNQLLTELDGVESSQGVYILAASSRPDLIDPALLRPGRIDKTLYCNIPFDKNQRNEIFCALSQDLPVSAEIKFDDLAAASVDFTGADIKALLYNAQLLAVNKMLSNSTESLKDNDQSILASRDVGISSNVEAELGGQHHLGHTTHSTKFKVWHFQRNSESKGVTKTNLHDVNPVIEQLLSQNKEVNVSQKKNSSYVITFSDLQAALEGTKPSLPLQERKKYENIYKKFQNGTNAVDIPNQRATLA